MLVPNSRTEALLMALANTEPAEEPVLDLRSRIKGGADGELGILTAFVTLLGDLESLLSC
jgi:hypothetical protein